MTASARDFRMAFCFWYRGWGFLFAHRSLLALALLPTMIALLSAAGFAWLLFDRLGDWSRAWVDSLSFLGSGVWHDLAYYPVLLGAGVVIILATLYAAFLLQILVAIPFFSLLSDRTLVKLGKKPPTDWRTTVRMIKVGLVKTVVFLGVGVILFVFTWIPILNLVSLFCALLVMAFDLIDYSFENVGMGFRDRLAYLYRERVQWIGMAAGLALTMVIPGLTLLVTPGAVVGGAMILKTRGAQRHGS